MICNNNNNFIFQKYTLSYFKEAFVNKHDIYNQTQTKLIHVWRWHRYQDTTTLIRDNDDDGDFY